MDNVKAVRLSGAHEYLKLHLSQTFMGVFGKKKKKSCKSTSTESSNLSVRSAVQHLSLFVRPYSQIQLSNVLVCTLHIQFINKRITQNQANKLKAN